MDQTRTRYLSALMTELSDVSNINQMWSPMVNNENKGRCPCEEDAEGERRKELEDVCER